MAGPRILLTLSLLLAACSHEAAPVDPVEVRAQQRQGASEANAFGTGTLIVLNKAAATASLVDLGSGKVVATVPTGEAPHEVAVSPAGELAVATNYGTAEAPGSSLTVISVESGAVVRTIELGEFHRPHGIQFTDADSVIVTVEEEKSVLCVDVLRAAIECTIETGQDVSHMISVTRNRQRAFVANIGSGSVSVLDLEKRALVESIKTGKGAEGVDVIPGDTQVWITNREADSITVLDTGSLEVLASLESESFPIRAAATPDGAHVLVTNARSGQITVFDTKTFGLVRSVAIELSAEDSANRLFGDKFGDSSVPIGILVHPDGKLAFVAHANADVVTVLDLESWTVTGTLKAGKEPDGLGYSRLAFHPPGSRTVYD